MDDRLEAARARVAGEPRGLGEDGAGLVEQVVLAPDPSSTRASARRFSVSLRTLPWARATSRPFVASSRARTASPSARWASLSRTSGSIAIRLSRAMATDRSTASMARCHSPRICSARPTQNQPNTREKASPMRSAISTPWLGVPQGVLRLARHVAPVGRVQVAEADDLEVALLARDPPAALDQTRASSSSPSPTRTIPLNPWHQAYGQRVVHAAAERRVAARQLDRAVAHGDRLTVRARAHDA